MEEAVQVWKEEGFEEGIEKGREEGIEKGKLEIAGNLLARGYSPETVSEIAGLSHEKIMELIK